MTCHAVKGFALTGVLLASCSGAGGSSDGGGEDSSPALTVGFELGTSSVLEGATAQVAVVLTARNGPLDEPLQFVVRAAGDASPGADHDFIADRVVEFPIGSPSGAAVDVDVQVVLDSLVEAGDETLALSLASPTRGALARRTHTLVIEETDFALLSFPATDLVLAEGAAGTVEVELSLEPGDTLGVDVDVTLADSGGGTATSGVDYQALSAQLSFTSGSAAGTRQSVVLQSIDDLDPEADETVELALTGASAGAFVTTPAHVSTITDDDVAGSPFLVVTTALGGGPAQAVADGEAFDLGAQPLDAGPNQALELTLQNVGDQPIVLEPLRLSGDTADFSLDLNEEPDPLPAVTHGAFPLAIEQDDVDHGACLSIDALHLSALRDAGVVTLYDVDLPGGGTLTLELERSESPIDESTVVHVDGVPVGAEALLGDSSMWHGQALGYPESRAFLSFSSLSCQGWVRLGDGLGALHLNTEFSSGGPIVRWLWDAQLESAYTGDAPGVCQGDRLLPGLVPSAEAPGVSSEAMTLGRTLPECRLAIETDYQLYAKFGDTTAVSQYVTQLVAAVSDMYERDVQTSLSIVYLGIHSDPDDGWTAQDLPGSDAGDVLDEFRAAWAGNLPAGAHLAHFVSGAPLGGGVAYVGVLCNSSFGFGVSGSINGNIDWGAFVGAPSVLSWDFVVVAHELGHNFGSSHTHSYCPPLDNCYTNCDASTACTPGTIMSYCHLCGGMANIRLEFHPFVAQRIRANVGSSCLADASLAAGGHVSVTVSFDPTTDVGSSSALLELIHSAPNEPSPFAMALSGTSTN
ncbi:MAG: hypothetical protein GY711_26215 [bacterium]|nr:hypothetical protein [bacterium]